MDSKTIAKIAQIASALEVSGYPKPEMFIEPVILKIWNLKTL